MQNNQIIILTILAATVITLLLSAFIIYILFKYTQKQAILRNSFDKEILKAQLEIQEQTFKHISQDLHDNITQFLNLAKLHLTTSRTKQKEISRSAVINLIDLCQEEILHLSQSINGEYIAQHGLLKMMEQYIKRLEKVGHFNIKFEVLGEPKYLEDDVETMLFRIIQETINNVIKHAKATSISLSFFYTDNSLKLVLEDNGRGFNAQEKLESGYKNGSFGLQNIIRRSQIINASFEIDSLNQKGTTICITIPM